MSDQEKESATSRVLKGIGIGVAAGAIAGGIAYGARGAARYYKRESVRKEMTRAMSKISSARGSLPTRSLPTRPLPTRPLPTRPELPRSIKPLQRSLRTPRVITRSPTYRPVRLEQITSEMRDDMTTYVMRSEPSTYIKRPVPKSTLLPVVKQHRRRERIPTRSISAVTYTELKRKNDIIIAGVDDHVSSLTKKYKNFSMKEKDVV